MKTNRKEIQSRIKKSLSIISFGDEIKIDRRRFQSSEIRMILKSYFTEKEIFFNRFWLDRNNLTYPMKKENFWHLMMHMKYENCRSYNIPGVCVPSLGDLTEYRKDCKQCSKISDYGNNPYFSYGHNEN